MYDAIANHTGPWMSAFQTINGTIKRTLVDSLSWYKFIKDKAMPKLETDAAAAKADIEQTLDELTTVAQEATSPYPHAHLTCMMWHRRSTSSYALRT